MAWSPLAEGKNDFFNNPVLKEIGKKYNKSVAQVSLRFHTQNGAIVIPKSAYVERMKENINIFDFKLAKEEIKEIEKLDLGKSLFFDYNDPELVDFLKEYQVD